MGELCPLSAPPTSGSGRNGGAALGCGRGPCASPAVNNSHSAVWCLMSFPSSVNKVRDPSPLAVGVQAQDKGCPGYLSFWAGEGVTVRG